MNKYAVAGQVHDMDSHESSVEMNYVVTLQ